ncbi:MAG: hypothetical protein RSB41_00825 [Bacilli bacterium]
MKNKSLVIRIGVTLIFTCLLYYVSLPALNLTDPSFYVFLIMIFVIYKITGLLSTNQVLKDFIVNKKLSAPKLGIEYFVVVGGILLIVVVNFICSPLFNSKSYSKRIVVNEDSNFTEDVKEVNFNALPLLDKDSSRKLGDRVMGQMPELVSQFQVSSLYTQINYKNDIIRVTPLEYEGIIKYFTNRKNGVKGYITVNSVTGDTKLTKLDKGMKYMPSAMFNENLERHLRFKYPTKIFGNMSFEIDNEGTPYWIIPTIKYTAVGLKEEIDGAIILNPVSGEAKNYKIKDIPKWVDQVFSADLIIEQVDDWGSLKKGYLNSIFGQKGVVKTTEGYNYTVQDDDVYMYTGITSASADQSNIGFILTNLRTKQTNFYSSPGAEEYSAMESAKGQVQQMNYTASFPLLINLNGRATYLVSLKDKAGLVKMYSFVDVADYQKVVVTDSSLGIEEAARNYLANAELNVDTSKVKSKNIIIENVTSAVIDGVSYYYLTDTNNQKYKVSVKANESYIPFITRGNSVNITYIKEEEVINILSINK